MSASPETQGQARRPAHSGPSAEKPGYSAVRPREGGAQRRLSYGNPALARELCVESHREAGTLRLASAQPPPRLTDFDLHHRQEPKASFS